MQLDRRDFLTIPGRAALAYWLGSFWGARQASKEVDRLKEEPISKTPQGRELREAYEAEYSRGTTSVALLALGSMSAIASSQNSKVGRIEDAVSQVPKESRPPEMANMDDYVKGVNRRQAMSACGKGVIAASLFGPAVTYFSNPGEEVAQRVHGDESNENRTERKITENKANREALIANALGIGGVAAIVKNQIDQGHKIADAKIVLLKHAIERELSQKRSFTLHVNDLTLCNRELSTLLPDSLKTPKTVLRIKLQRGNNENNYSMYYRESSNDKPQGFYLQCLSKEIEPVTLQFGNRVTISRVE